jgi:hypothetical protein
MDNEKKYTTSLRLYKCRPVHAQAYRCLKNYNRDIFKTKDDFIAEAVVHFSKYLKQAEEEKQVEGWNRYLERQNEPLLRLVKSAVSEVQGEQLLDLIRGIVEEMQGVTGKLQKEDLPAGEKDYVASSQKDMMFAQFYDCEDD